MKFLKGLAIIFMVMAPFLLLEAASRVYFCVKYKSPHFLTYGKKSRTEGEKINIYDGVRHKAYGSYFKSVPGDYKQPYRYKRFDVHINKHGFRGEEFDDIPTKYRIFCLGGSTVEDLEVEDGKDWPSQLQKELGDGYEVINAGIIGQSTTNIINLINHEILGYKPRALVIYEAFNDYHTMHSFGKMSRWYAKVFSLLYNKSLLFAIIVEKKFIFSKKEYPEKEVSMCVDKYRENIKTILDIGRANNIKVFLVKQAINTDNEFYLKTHARMMKVLDEFNGIDIKLDKEDFYDIAHLTESGDAKVAKQIREAIWKNLN
jgi:lysophospholipase L1-like esterase